MNGRLRRSARYLFAALAMTGFAAVEARADPSTDCRNLASWFGSQPARLDMRSLAMLSTYVTDEIQARTATPLQPPAPDPQGTDPPPTSQVPAQGDETWPTPPAWKDNAVDSKPWDKYDQ